MPPPTAPDLQLPWLLMGVYRGPVEASSSRPTSALYVRLRFPARKLAARLEAEGGVVDMDAVECSLQSFEVPPLRPASIEPGQRYDYWHLEQALDRSINKDRPIEISPNTTIVESELQGEKWSGRQTEEGWLWETTTATRYHTVVLSPGLWARQLLYIASSVSLRVRILRWLIERSPREAVELLACPHLQPDLGGRPRCDWQGELPGSSVAGLLVHPSRKIREFALRWVSHRPT